MEALDVATAGESVAVVEEDEHCGNREVAVVRDGYRKKMEKKQCSAIVWE